MPSNDKVIADLDAIFGNPGANTVGGKSRYIDLVNSTQEPRNWPLTRRATTEEWNHVVKAMIVRQVPKTRPISRRQLLDIVREDLLTASESGRIYVGPDFSKFINTVDLMHKLMHDKILRSGMGQAPPGSPTVGVISVFRTEFTEGWEKLIPKTVEAILRTMPTNNVLDLLVDALIDGES